MGIVSITWKCQHFQVMQTKFTELSDSQWEVIEKYLNDHSPRKHDLRTILNAILWVTRVGAQWRNLESKYPKWESVYYYFRIWKKNGTLALIMSELVKLERIRQGREPAASAAAIDSQSVKIVAFLDQETGIDGGKKVNGRKRHLVVDTLGLPLAIHVSSANTADFIGGFELLAQLGEEQTRLELIRADQAYAKAFTQAAHWYGIEIDTAKKPPSAEGFIPQKGRWQVERSFSWMNFFRRLSRDYERLAETAVAFIQLMFISIILARVETN